mmetsp:Transcript_22871/g.77221  ORF Transcript_22871/g.77221 Transcript_22871/m.77221 type:complete len:95 (-) Transcript_22871:6-290(-)
MNPSMKLALNPASSCPKPKNIISGTTDFTDFFVLKRYFLVKHEIASPRYSRTGFHFSALMQVQQHKQPRHETNRETNQCLSAAMSGQEELPCNL